VAPAECWLVGRDFSLIGLNLNHGKTPFMTTFAFLGAFVFAWPRKGVKRSDEWTEPKSQARQICCSSDVRTGEMGEGLAVKHRRYQISGRETPSSKCGGAKLIDDFR
jgi:hypothetical protein